MLDKIPKFYLVEKNDFFPFLPYQAQEVPLSYLLSHLSIYPSIMEETDVVRIVKRKRSSNSMLDHSLTDLTRSHAGTTDCYLK